MSYKRNLARLIELFNDIISPLGLRFDDPMPETNEAAEKLFNLLAPLYFEFEERKKKFTRDKGEALVKLLKLNPTEIKREAKKVLFRRSVNEFFLTYKPVSDVSVKYHVEKLRKYCKCSDSTLKTWMGNAFKMTPTEYVKKKLNL